MTSLFLSMKLPKKIYYATGSKFGKPNISVEEVIITQISPRFLFSVIPTKLRVYNTRYCDNIPLLKIKHNYFKNSFFLFSVVE